MGRPARQSEYPWDAQDQASLSKLGTKRVLVTGGGGFLGSHIIDLLVSIGAEVHSVVRSQSWAVTRRMKGLNCHRADLTVASTVRRIARLVKPHVVFHVGAYGVARNATSQRMAVLTNVLGTANTLAAALEGGVERFVHVGSGFEYVPTRGRVNERTALVADTMYGATKIGGFALVEHYGYHHGLPTVTIRPFGIYGPRESPKRLVAYAVRRALANQPIRLIGANRIRDYAYVGDVARAIGLAGVRDAAIGCVFNIGTGRGTRVDHMVRQIVGILGSSSSVECVASIPGRADRQVFVADPRRARAKLGWRARVGFREGVTRTAAYLSRSGRRDAL